MRMDQDDSSSIRGGKQRTAANVVNSFSEQQLADIIFHVRVTSFSYNFTQTPMYTHTHTHTRAHTHIHAHAQLSIMLTSLAAVYQHRATARGRD